MHVYTRVSVCMRVHVRERECCVHSHCVCTHTDVIKQDRTCRCRVETGAKSRQPPPREAGRGTKSQ